MKIQNNLFFAALMSVIALSASGIVSAQEEQEMSNQQYCEKEAKEAGMSEEQDVQEYVAQCLAELNAKNSPAAEAEGGA